MRSFAKAAKTSGLIVSALMCVFGLLLILIPGFFSELAGIMVGIAMIVYGCSKLFAYISGDPFRVALRGDLAGGIILLLLGLILITHPKSVMMIISFAAGIYMISDGVSKMQTAVQSRKLGFTKWWLLFALAIITGIMGIIMLFSSESDAILMTFLGISLLSDGILNIMTICTASKYFKNIRSDLNIIDVEGHEKDN